ncbi:hypothetical protein C0992_006134, partial [Termitomyces sp. T32_za158]
FDITYVKGELNKVVDCLLQYFKSDTHDNVHEVHDFVQADKRIDLEGEDLPLHWFQEIAERHVEIQAMQAHELRHSKQLKEQLEVQDLEAQGLASAEPAVIWPMKELLLRDDNPTGEQALGIADPSPRPTDLEDVQLHAYIWRGYDPSPRTTDLEDAQLHAYIWRGYLQDKFYVKILDESMEHPHFVI